MTAEREVRMSRGDVLIARIVTTLCALFAIGLAFWFPLDWHKSFPGDGMFNLSLPFSGMALVLAAWFLFISWVIAREP